MNKPYWSGPGTGGASRFADDPSADPESDGYRSFDGYGKLYGHHDSDNFDPPTDDLGIYEDYDFYDRPDNRWRWVAALAGVVLLVALIAIGVAMRGGGDSSTSSATPSPSAAPEQDAISTTPRTVIATVAPTSEAPPAEALPPETVVTVTPTPTAEAAPTEAPAEAPPPPATPPAQTTTYTVTGTRQLFDLVSVIYTDEQGFPRTDVNVALPWTRTVVLNPGVLTRSVTATSLTGQLNCAVTDGTGATLAAQSNNAAIASCTP